MSACKCEDCSPDGIASPTYTREHMRHCEALSVANMRSDKDRRLFLGLVSQSRGTEAADELRAEAWKILQERMRK